MLFKSSAGGAILKGIAVQKVVAASAAAVVTVSAVGTAAKLSSDNIASGSQPAEPQSTAVVEQADLPAAAQPEAAAAQGVSAAEEAQAAAGAAPVGHITSIRGEDQVIRREYYDESDQLFEYSDVLNYDPETNSYTENVYRYDEETGREILVRTETYQNGQLVTSGTPSTPAATQVPDAVPSPAPKPVWQGRVTSITVNGQVVRREYYDDSGRLCQYSDVVNDNETGSYVENVYQYDEETNTEILVRTETGQGTPAATPAPTAAPTPVVTPAPTAAPAAPTAAPAAPTAAPAAPSEPPAEPAPAVVPDPPAEPVTPSEPAPSGETTPAGTGEQSEP